MVTRLRVVTGLLLLLRLLLLPLLLLAPKAAWAEEALVVGTIVRVVEPNAGLFSERPWGISPTAVIRCTEDPDNAPQRRATVGTELHEDDLLTTNTSRVTVKRTDGTEIIVAEGSSITLKEWGLLDVMGSVFVRAANDLIIISEGVQAAVEGTRFSFEVTPDGDVEVKVEEGRVRVASSKEEVLLSAGRSVQVSPDNRMSLSSNLSNPGALALRPRPLSLGVQLGAGLGDYHAAEQPPALSGRWSLELVGRLELFGPLELVASGGVVHGAEGGYPVTLGLELRPLPRLSFGVQGNLTWGFAEVCSPAEQTEWVSALVDDGGWYQLSLGGGASATLGLRQTIARRWALDARLHAGWAYGPSLGGAAGLSYRF